MSAMDRSLIERALSELGRELLREGLHADVFVVGGAAITLAFEDRPATKDVDAVFTNPARVRAAAERVGVRLDLPPDWLNDGVKGFLPHSVDPDADVFLDEPGLRVMVASPRYVLGMKLAAARVAEDAADIKRLAAHLGLNTTKEVLEVATTLYEGTGLQLPPRTRFLVEEMLGPSSSPPSESRQSDPPPRRRSHPEAPQTRPPGGRTQYSSSWTRIRRTDPPDRGR